jgi:ferric-dicitrate binding protein FerR (iron transport regulator)
VHEIDASCHRHNWETIRQQIVSLPHPAHRPPLGVLRRMRNPFVRYAAAAVVLIATGLTLWLILRQPSRQPVYTSASCGLKLPSKEEEEEIIRINMVHDKISFAVPRSWQYTLTLPDGSTVWLNAASSITYPRSFTGNSREVTIEGEAYFHIDSSHTQPFYVTTQGKRLPAPGNSFNINGYEEEVIVSIDTVQSNSWKEGYFAFKQAGVQTVVAELARWYDWKVVYSSGVKPATVTASFCRNTSESEALKTLRSHGIQFEKQGDELTVF